MNVNEKATAIAITSDSIEHLVGVQKSLALFVYDECMKNFSKVTNPLTLKYITSKINASAETIRKSLQRLEEKGIISRKEFKNGRGGWSKYSISDEVANDIKNTFL